MISKMNSYQVELFALLPVGSGKERRQGRAGIVQANCRVEGDAFGALAQLPKPVGDDEVPRRTLVLFVLRRSAWEMRGGAVDEKLVVELVLERTCQFK